MAKQIINIGTVANDRTGDPLRTAFTKVNENFTELYDRPIFSGSYGDLSDKPTIPSDINQLVDSSNLLDQIDFNFIKLIDSGYRLVGEVISFAKTDFGSEIDYIDAGLAITRGDSQGIFNPLLEEEYDRVEYSSPAGTEWNADGWADLSNVTSRTYTTWREALETNVSAIVGQELVMHDIANDKYYAIKFTQWTQGIDPGGVQGGGFTYERQLIAQAVIEFADGSIQQKAVTDVSDLTDFQGLLGGGTSSTSLPFLELTNDPFITQPAILGEDVSVDAEPAGSDARYNVVIGEGPVIESVSVAEAGSGYIEGQRYRVLRSDIGGSGNDSHIDFEIETVDADGEVLSITNVTFSGSEPNNTPGTYNNRFSSYLPSVFDEIDTGITLTRGRQGALFNVEAEQEYNRDTYISPIGTLWNSDGWGDLLNLPTRSYTTLRSSLNNEIGENIIGAELVMWDTINNKFYKFNFTQWGQGEDAGFAYTRNLVTDPNYFNKADYGNEIDVIVEDDGEGNGIGITRGNNQGIYNPYREGSWDSGVSPEGTLWNVDGWGDLTNVETRNYTNFRDAYGGQLGNRVPGSRAILYIPEIDKYYAVQWLSWTQGGSGGGFSYIRKELDLTQLEDGVTFADGTKIRSTNDLVKPVRAQFPGDRRIEEATGYKEINLLEVDTVIVEGVTSRAVTDSNVLYVPRPSAIFDITNNYSNFVDNPNDIEFSLDGDNWYKWSGSATLPAGEYGYFLIDANVTYSQGDTVYLRYLTNIRPVEWWNKNELPNGGGNFRGAVIDYHAYDTNMGTIVGTIHIVSDSDDRHVTHTEVSSGSSRLQNLDLWISPNEGRLAARKLDGQATTVKIQWIAKVFYGSEYYD